MSLGNNLILRFKFIIMSNEICTWMSQITEAYHAKSWAPFQTYSIRISEGGAQQSVF